MKNIQVEVTESALNKMEKAGIKYKITNADVDLEKLFNCHTDISELNEMELARIIETAKKAIDEGVKYGIEVETRSGRDMNDKRCYTLVSVIIVDADQSNCTFTVKEMITAGY
jgi:hypothetical protein